MNEFNKILYVSRALEDDDEALTQALAIADNNEAPLTVLTIYPPFPESLGQYRDKWEKALEADTTSAVDNARASRNTPDSDIPVTIKIDCPDLPAEEIIRRVLRDRYDLVIKAAEPLGQGKGHKALDMELLRKCPCPVWLARPIGKPRKEISVGVAIDPSNHEIPAMDLAVRLLTVAAFLAENCDGTLQVVSCWDCEYEGFLRHHPFAKIPADEVTDTVRQVEKNNAASLADLIGRAGLVHYDVHHIRGKPEEIVPSFVKNKHIDILVMGTVARAGIPGFIMGNTAENIVQKLNCSLLALKPGGFVSPVKAY